MRVHLLGTGGADGWPNPFCRCASCSWMVGHGEVRGQTAALVDDRLMLDCGPEAPRAALRHGASLAGVRTVLLTHAHPDHTGPAALVWRGWANHPDELVVGGPRPALDLCRPWLGARDRVRLVELSPGDELEIDGYQVRALAARHGDPSVQPTLLYDLTGPRGSRLFYACDTGPLPKTTVEALRGAALDLVLMEETFGDGAEPGHLDLTTFGVQVARLRRVGAVGPTTQVAAVHLGHRNPPPPVLRQRLSAWGVVLPDDGTVFDVAPRGTRGGDDERARVAEHRATAPAHVAAPAAGDDLRSRHEPRLADGGAGPRRVLVLGGARSGKSSFAESLLAAEPAVTYVATARNLPRDAEWAARLADHRARRPSHWRTVETTDLVGVLPRTSGAVLVDCLTLWLADRLEAGDDGRSAAVAATEAADEYGTGVEPGVWVGAGSGDEPGDCQLDGLWDEPGSKYPGRRPDEASERHTTGHWDEPGSKSGGELGDRHWDEPGGEPGDGLFDGLFDGLSVGLARETAVDQLVTTWRGLTGLVVAVTNEVGAGIVPATADGRRFRDALGVLNARLAAESEEVWLVVAGIPRRLA